LYQHGYFLRNRPVQHMPEPDTAPAPTLDSLTSGPAELVLLHDITRWREQLARSIARNNPALRSESIATAVNRILFSFLYLRMMKDRGLIAAGMLRTMADSCSTGEMLPSLLRYTRGLYDEVTPSLHGGGEDFPGLIIDNHVLLTIFSPLVSPERDYDLAVMPAENIAGILQQYLAMTVRRSATHQAIIVEDHDTLHTGRTTSLLLPVFGYLAKSSLDSARAHRSLREILPIRVLDPACGAGSVLLAAYQDLLDHYPGGEPDIEERREILTASFYGVDINPHAVAATRLLLLFRLAETIRPGSGLGDFPLFSEAVFRDLRHTIRCGNALIGPEIVGDESWMFCPTRDRHALRPFDWKQEYPEIFAAGGFDAVITNPPEGLLGDREWIQQYFQRHYTVFHPSMDQSAYFLEKSLALVTTGGSVSCLMNNRWLRGAGGSRLREELRSLQIEDLVDFSGIPAGAPGAALSILRVRAMPPSHPFPVTLADPGFFEHPSAFVAIHRFPIDQRMLDKGGWQFRDTRGNEIVRRVYRHSTLLEDFVMGQVFSGMVIPGNDPYVIDKHLALDWGKRDPQSRPLIRRLVGGAEIGRYHAGKTGKFFLLIPQGWTVSRMKGEKQPLRWLKHRHPLIARHLKPFAETLKARAGPDRLWWESDSDEFWQEPHKKILFSARFSTPAFLFDAGRTVGDETTLAIPAAGPYLSGILNSRLIRYVFNLSVRKSAPGRQWFSWDDLRDIPVYTPDFDQPADRARHNRMENLVQRRIDLEKSCQAAVTDEERGKIQQKIQAADRRIDALVYDLYGLTAEEIALVEETFDPPPSPNT
jgi:hypothetical protein